MRSFLRVVRRTAIPCLVLGLALLGVLYVLVLPRVGARVDLTAALAVIKRQWFVPVIAVHATLVFAGLVYPYVRGDSAGRATRTALLSLPAIWLHVLAAQILVLFGLVAGVVPGILALAPAALVAAAVADGGRGLAAFDVAAAAVAPRRWRFAGVILGLILVEVGLTIATWKLLVPVLTKKTPAVTLLISYRFAWINAIRTAITTPIAATVLAALFARWRGRRDASTGV